MRSIRPSLILVTSLALMPLAGVASAGQARPRSAPPSQGSSSQGSTSQGSSSSQSGDQGRSRTQAQRRERESTPPPQQQQQQSQRQEQSRERQTLPQAQRPQQQYERPQQDDRRDSNTRQDNSRQAIPAPRDRYIDQNRDGRNDNRDSRVLGPQDRRDLERRNGGYYNSGSRYDGRYDRYDNRFSNYSNYRYDGPRVVFAPRQNMRFDRPWFSFRALVRLPFGLTLGMSTPFPTWYRPYIVGRPGYQAPYMPYGGVTFDIEPRDAELWVDGEYVGRASDYDYNDPPLTLVAGPHYVELRSRYGQPLAFDITVIPGQVIPYQGSLPYYR
jgi:hypothetical protein